MSRLRFPMFFDLNGKSCVIVGGGKIGLRRAAVLRDFGASVTIIDPQPLSCEGVYCICRRYESGDLDGAFLCVAATDDTEVNRAVSIEAKRLGIPISVSDNPGECDFFFPAVCVGEGLVAGLVSDGEDHQKTARAAREIRSVLEGFK